MSSAWPMVPLGEVLTKSVDWIQLRPDHKYKEVTVRLWGNGTTLRREVLGAEIASESRLRVRANQFIISRIDARNGASGLIPKELDGAVVSSDFPVFTPNSERLECRFLGWLTKTKAFIELCKAASEGTTNRVRLKEDRFLSTTIPLPPLSEQRHLVERIDALAAKIEEAKRLRQKVNNETSALQAAIVSNAIPPQAPQNPLGELIEPGSTISYGVLVPGPDMEGGVPFVRIQDLSVDDPPETPNKRISPDIEAGYKRTRLRGGEVLIGVVGSIGKVGIAPSSWAGANIARAVCRILPGPKLDRDYLAQVLRSKPIQAHLKDATRTLAQPTLNVGQLEKTPIPCPPLDAQRSIVGKLTILEAELAKLRKQQSETAGEIDAMLPAILDRAFRGELV